MNDESYATPEQAALARWTTNPRAEARVISVECTDEAHAVGVTDTVPERVHDDPRSVVLEA